MIRFGIDSIFSLILQAGNDLQETNPHQHKYILAPAGTKNIPFCMDSMRAIAAAETFDASKHRKGVSPICTGGTEELEFRTRDALHLSVIYRMTTENHKRSIRRRSTGTNLCLVIQFPEKKVRRFSVSGLPMALRSFKQEGPTFRPIG